MASMPFASVIVAAACLFAPAQSAQSTPGRPRTLTGDVRMIDRFHSTILGNDRPLWIYLPPNYDREPRRRYPVLYMQDGQNLFNLETSYLPDQEWRVDESAQSLIEAGLLPPMIIVGIANAGAARGDEYLPTRAQGMGGQADRYGRMLTEELIPYIDRTYRTKKGPQNTGLGGSSFGGIVSLYVGLRFPDVFGKLAVMSPSVWWDNRTILSFVDALPHRPATRIWVDIGTHEGHGAEPDAVALRDHLIVKGWRLGRDLAFFRDFDAQHNERAWAHRIPSVLTFLFAR